MNLWLIPFFPLVGFLLNGLLGRRLSKPIVSLIAVGSVAASFAFVLAVLGKLYPLSLPYSEHYFTWIQSGSLNVGFDFDRRSPHCRHAAGRHRRRTPDSHLFRRLHGA